jgi:hypothetical protein
MIPPGKDVMEHRRNPAPPYLVRWLLLGLFGLVLLGASVLVNVPFAGAQVPPLVGRGAYAADRVGIPSERQVQDVRWSGDRRGEFIEIGLLPEAFRGPTPVPPDIPFRAPVPGPSPSPVRVPTILIPSR